MKQHPYDLLVFDWDGTLMDSEARIVESLEAAIADVGLEPRSRAALREIIGLGLAEALQQLFPMADQETVSRLIERYRHHFLIASRTPMPLFAGVSELLARLEQAGYYLAVATGKARRGLDQVLKETNLHGRFHCTRCADETRSKPHPQMLLEVIERTGVAPERTLMIGDTEFDLLMARSAGVDALGVTYGVHARERLLACEPRGLVDSVSELHGWLFGSVADAMPGR